MSGNPTPAVVDTTHIKSALPTVVIACNSGTNNNNETATPTVQGANFSGENNRNEPEPLALPLNILNASSGNISLFGTEIESKNGLPRLQYQRDYPIQRFGRKWSRYEVTGYFCLVLEAILVAALIVISLKAVGYFDGLLEDSHYPLTFSWKYLWEFISGVTVPEKISSCLFDQDEKRPAVPTDDEELQMPAVRKENVIVYNYDRAGMRELWQIFISYWKEFGNGGNLEDLETASAATAKFVDKHKCVFRGPWAWYWILKLLMAHNILSILQFVTSMILLTFLSARRVEWIGKLCLSIAMISWIVGFYQFYIFSVSANTDHLDRKLFYELRGTYTESNPPFALVPIIDHTQVHHQCCGPFGPETWNLRQGEYPPSCCNYTAFNCSGLEVITKKHVWKDHCFLVELTTIRSFVFWMDLLYAIRVVTEFTILLIVCEIRQQNLDIAPEARKSSRCFIKGYKVTCWGAMYIKGVTTDNRVVVQTDNFLRRNFQCRQTSLQHGVRVEVYTKNERQGYVDVVKRFHVENLSRNDIQVDGYLSRWKIKKSFVFSMK